MFGSNNNQNNNGGGKITHKIKRECGTLSTGNSGWSVKATIISWNGGSEKLDIRPWNSDMTKCGKGVSLTESEAQELYRILGGMFGGGR